MEIRQDLIVIKIYLLFIDEEIDWNYLNMPALDKYQFAKFYEVFK